MLVTRKSIVLAARQKAVYYTAISSLFHAKLIEDKEPKRSEEGNACQKNVFSC